MAGFEFRFVAMGMGDCTMIKCPDGKIIIIDCGTSSEGQFHDSQAHINSARVWLEKNMTANTIHTVVLTHADKDHYNRFWHLLSDYEIEVENDSKKVKTKKRLTVKNVYFSCPPSNLLKDPLGAYTGLSIGAWFSNGKFKTENLYLVNINDKSDKNNHLVNYIPINKMFTVASKNIVSVSGCKHPIASDKENNIDWSVDIIAGNVGEAKKLVNDGTRKNANSLVVKVTYGTKNALFMGDGDMYTQSFLLNSSNKSSISKVTLMSAPHHGSRENFYASFHNHVKKIDTLIVSSEYMEHKHSLPNYKDSIEEWEKRVKGTSDKHQTFYYDKVSKKDHEKVLGKFDEWLKLPDDESEDPHKLIFKNKFTLGRWSPDSKGRVIIRRMVGQINLMSEKITDERIFHTSAGSIVLGLDSNGVNIIELPWKITDDEDIDE